MHAEVNHQQVLCPANAMRCRAGCCSLPAPQCQLEQPFAFCLSPWSPRLVRMRQIRQGGAWHGRRESKRQRVGKASIAPIASAVTVFSSSPEHGQTKTTGLLPTRACVASAGRYSSLLSFRYHAAEGALDTIPIDTHPTVAATNKCIYRLHFGAPRTLRRRPWPFCECRPRSCILSLAAAPSSDIATRTGRLSTFAFAPSRCCETRATTPLRIPSVSSPASR
ncbi:hypothetical protein BDV95DRAFT_273607 [Massariosphaeria phaeospora]|uniref:Uncharacterized protein n=1 Tax=Massariosphaeria phaeospora TaxID=100035 RepID=A0A7C8IG05_9PLEO|nr:hypothetical protein BDV95DRAFT_273607 [Massariosphaeria phaeospora]